VPRQRTNAQYTALLTHIIEDVDAIDVDKARGRFPHHWLTHPMQMLQIMPVMGYVAAHAQGMTIGPNILILPPLNPMHVAEEAATIDVLTGGNYILGIGLGYRQPEFDAFGISLSERAPRFNESIALMRRLWTEERVTHKGRFYTVNDAGISVKPVRPGGPPLYIAGQADVSVKRAARIGDAWLIVNTSGLGKISSRKTRPSCGAIICCWWRSKRRSRTSKAISRSGRSFTSSRPASRHMSSLPSWPIACTSLLHGGCTRWRRG
jgi:hypothetical protein